MRRRDLLPHGFCYNCAEAEDLKKNEEKWTIGPEGK